MIHAIYHQRWVDWWHKCVFSTSVRVFVCVWEREILINILWENLQDGVICQTDAELRWTGSPRRRPRSATTPNHQNDGEMGSTATCFSWNVRRLTSVFWKRLSPAELIIEDRRHIDNHQQSINILLKFYIKSCFAWFPDVQMHPCFNRKHPNLEYAFSEKWAWGVKGAALFTLLTSSSYHRWRGCRGTGPGLSSSQVASSSDRFRVHRCKWQNPECHGKHMPSSVVLVP